MDIKTTVNLNNGIKIPILGFGVWQIPKEICKEAVIAALNAGYRHIDTAAVYGNEESVGDALRETPISRKELFITTKLWNEDHYAPEKAFNGSLKNLKLDYVDLYLIHFPVPERNDSWRVLEKIYRSGRAKAIGVSNFTIDHLNGLLKIVDIVPAVNQIEFHPYLYQKELLDFCKQKDIGIEAYSPLTHGVKLYDPKLIKIANKYQKSTAQILIRWGLQHNLIVLAKSANKKRMIENASIFDFSIAAEDMGVLDKFDEGLRTCWDPTIVP